MPDHSSVLTLVPAVPADPSPPSPRILYALSLFSWLKAHPDASRDQFLAMIDRAEARAAKLGEEPR
jgi:hypothetical protein